VQRNTQAFGLKNGGEKRQKKRAEAEFGKFAADFSASLTSALIILSSSGHHHTKIEKD
jgi:hypothetical protein